MKSKLFTLNLNDGWKAFIIAVGAPVLYWIQEAIPGWNIPQPLKVGLAAAVPYLIKNFFTDDTKVAEKIVDEAGGKVVPKSAKVIPVILALVAFSFCGYSQSNLFSPIAKKKVARSLIAGITSEPTFWSFRPAIIGATIFVGGTTEAAAGTGIAYQNITQKGDDQRSYVNYDIGAYVLAGGSVVPGHESDIEKFALVGSALNGMVGLGYAMSRQLELSTGNKKWKGGLALIWKINFNN